jgi:hypothetical protein
MSIVECTCWQCDLCGHRWILIIYGKPPRQCPKCRKTGWNIKVAESLSADVGRKAKAGPVKPELPVKRRGSLTKNTGRMAQRAVEAEEPARPKIDYAVTPWLDPKEANHLRQFIAARGKPPESITEWNWFLHHG